MRASGSATIVRTAWVSGAHGANMVKTVLRLAAADPGGTLRFVADQHGCPTFTADLAQAVVRLGLDRRPGTFHVTNQGETTWFGFARATLAAAGLDPDRVEPIATSELDPPRPAPRPANSRLDNAALRLAGLPLLPLGGVVGPPRGVPCPGLGRRWTGRRRRRANEPAVWLQNRGRRAEIGRGGRPQRGSDDDGDRSVMSKGLRRHRANARAGSASGVGLGWRLLRHGGAAVRVLPHGRGTRWR